MGVLERNVRDDVGQLQGNAPSTDNRRQMDMFEDERQRASLRRHGAIARGVAKRGLVAFLAFAMAFGTTPAQMWADGAEGIAEAVAAATAGEGSSAADGSTADAGAVGAAADTAAGQDASASAANSDDATASDAISAEGPAATISASEQGDGNAAAVASATTLSDDAKVYIQDTKDKDNSYSTKSGALKAGDTLWANMYDEVETEDDWGDFTTETQSVANPGTWTYTRRHG